jgi:hypothetical protein
MMREEIAGDLSCLLGSCVGLLEHMAHLVKDHGSEAEFGRYMQTTAQVLAALETQVLRPILTEYPALDPSSPMHRGDPGAPYPGGAILVQRHQDRDGRELRDPGLNDPLASERLPPEGMPPWEGLLVKDGRADKELAAVVMYFLRTTSAALIHTIWMLKWHGMEEEAVRKHAVAVGWVLATMAEEIIWHIDDKYPDLDSNSPSYLRDGAIHEGRLYRERQTDEPGPGPQEAQEPAPAGAAPSPPKKVSGKDTPMDKDVATRIAYIARSCAGMLRHTVWLVKQQGTEEEFVRYKKHMAVVLDELQTRMLAPLYAEHPDLDPQSPTYRAPTEAERIENFLPADEADAKEPGPGAGTT